MCINVYDIVFFASCKKMHCRIMIMQSFGYSEKSTMLLTLKKCFNVTAAFFIDNWSKCVKYRAFKVMLCFVVLTLVASISWGGQGTSRLTSVKDEDKELTRIYKFFHFIKDGNLEQIEEQLDAGCDLTKVYLQENSDNFQKCYENMNFLTTMQHVESINIYPIFFAICYNQFKIVERLLQENVDIFNVVESVSFSDEYEIFEPENFDKVNRKYTALEVAAYYGYSDIVKILYAYMNEMPLRLDTHLADDKRKFNLAFINAIKSKNDELVHWLLTRGAAIRTCEEIFDFEKKSMTYESAFSIAMSTGCIRVIKVLLTHIQPQGKMSLYRNTSWCSCITKHIYDTNFLSAPHEYTSPFIAAIESKHHNAILSFLENDELGKKIIPKEGEHNIANGMHAAITKQHSGAVTWMLKNCPSSVNVEIVMQCSDFNSPSIFPIILAMDHMVLGTDTEIVWSLLEAGAKTDVRLCKNFDRSNRVTLYEDAEKKLKRDKNGDENEFLCACRTQNIIMMYKMMQENKEIVCQAAKIVGCKDQYSIMNIATLRPSLKEHVYFFPLFIAAKNNDLATVERFLAYGANVQKGIKIIVTEEDQKEGNIVETDNIYTPLTIASFYGNEEIVSILLKKHNAGDDKQVCLFAALAATKGQCIKPNIVGMLLEKAACKNKEELYVVDPLCANVRYNVYDTVAAMNYDKVTELFLQLDIDVKEKITLLITTLPSTTRTCVSACRKKSTEL